MVVASGPRAGNGGGSCFLPSPPAWSSSFPAWCCGKSLGIAPAAQRLLRSRPRSYRAGRPLCCSFVLSCNQGMDTRKCQTKTRMINDARGMWSTTHRYQCSNAHAQEEAGGRIEGRAVQQTGAKKEKLEDSVPWQLATPAKQKNMQQHITYVSIVTLCLTSNNRVRCCVRTSTHVPVGGLHRLDETSARAKTGGEIYPSCDVDYETRVETTPVSLSTTAVVPAEHAHQTAVAHRTSSQSPGNIYLRRSRLERREKWMFGAKWYVRDVEASRAAGSGRDGLSLVTE